MSTHPKFSISKTRSGSFKWNLSAGNGEIILSSQIYKSKASCKNGIESVRKNCTYSSRFEKLKTRNGKHYFNLKARNGLIIGTSQHYTTSAGSINACKSVERNGRIARVEDTTN